MERDENHSRCLCPRIENQPISDFMNFQYDDLEDNAKRYSFRLDEFPAYLELFDCLARYKERDSYKHYNPVNIPAAEQMSQLHDRLKEIGYARHQLELHLVRLLFCLFADDIGIFKPPNLFNKYILEHTSENRRDFALHLQKVLEALNKPKDKRLKTIDKHANQFPCINSCIFEETIETANFDHPIKFIILIIRLITLLQRAL
jgi:hypothetical protein